LLSPDHPDHPTPPALPALPAPPAPPAQSKPKGVLFKAQGLGLLHAPHPAEWQKPQPLMDLLRIAERTGRAHLGAGGGWFTIQLARRVGPNGIVYGEDIQQPMIDFIGQRARRENLTWVKPILGTATDPRLPPGIDAMLIVDTYHEVEDPVALFR